MAGPFAERGAFLEAFQFGGTYTTPGATVSQDFNVIPGFLVVHVGLARVAAAEAIIGIVGFTAADGSGQVVNFGIPENWETAIYRRVSSFTIGAYVARGVMKGWFYIQAWN